MVCAGLEILSGYGIGDLLAFPNSCDHYFWAKILIAFFIILSYTLYKKDEEKIVKPNILSSMGISAIATIFIALILTYILDSNGNSIIPGDVFLEVIIGCTIFIVLWLFSKK